MVILFSILQTLELPVALQLILQDHRQSDTHDTNDQSTQKGVPPDGVRDDETKAERLSDNARQPEQEGIDHQREQTKRQKDQRAGQELEQRAEESVDETEDQRQPQDRNEVAP